MSASKLEPDMLQNPSAGSNAASETEITHTLDITNQKGLHARAAAAFVKVAETFSADIVVSKGGQEVCGKSIMGLMMLAAAKGSQIKVKVRGDKAQEAVDALTELVEAKFNEE